MNDGGATIRVVPMRTEVIQGGAVVWQASDAMKTYYCPTCHAYVFTQYEGDQAPTRFDCVAAISPAIRTHTIEWPDED